MRRNTTQRILSATTSALVDKGGVGQLARSAHTAEDLQPDLYRQGDLAFRTVNSQSPHPRRHPKQGRAAHHHNSINSQTTLARRHAELMSAMKMEGLPTVVMANADDRAVHVHVTDTSNKNRSSTTSLTSTKDQLVVKSQAYLETLVADLLVLQKGLSPPQPRARVPQAGKETDIECTAVGYNDNKDGNSTLMVTSSLSSTSHEAVKQLRSIVERKKSNNSNKLGNNGNFLSARSRMNTEEFAAMRSKSKLSVYTSEDGSGSHGFDEHSDQVERSQIGREQNPPSGSRTPYFSGGFYGSSPLNEHGSHQQVVFANHEERGDHPTRQSAEKMGDIQNMGEPSSELVDLLGSLCRGTLTEETTLAAEAAVALATATPSSRIVRKLGEMSTPALVTAFSIVNAKNPHALALLKDFLLQVPCCPPHRIIPPSTINKTTSVADRLLGLLYDQSSMSAFHLTISAKAMGMLHAHQPSAEEADAEREARELRETTNRDLDATSEINQHLHTEESSPFRNVNNNINNNNNNDGHIGAPMLPFFNDDPLLSLEYEHRPLLRWAVAKHYAAAGDWQRVLTVLSTQRGEDSEQEYLAATLFSKKLTSSLKNEIESAQIAGEALSDNKNTKRTTMTATRPSVQLCESERGLVFLAVFLSKASLKLTTAQQWTQLMKFITDVERSEQGEGKEREQVRKEEHYTPTATIASAKRNKQGKTLPALISACVSSPSLDGVSALELKAILTATGCPGNVARHFLTASSKRKISLCKILQSIQESNNAHTRSSSPTQRTTTREGQSGEQQRTKDATSSSCGGGDDALSQSAMDVMTVLLFRFAVTTHRSSQFDAEDYLRATEALARIVKMFGDSDHEEVLTKKHNDSSNREQTQNDMMGYEYLGFLPNPSSLSPLGASMIMKDIEAVIRGLDGILSTSQLSHRNHRASTRARNGGSREAHGMTMNSAEDYSIRHGQSSACAVTADYLVGALFDLWRQGHSVLPIIKRKTNTKASVAAREVHYCSGGPTPFALGRKQWEFISSLALRSMTSPASLTVGCQQKLCCNVYAKVLAVAANIGDPTTAFDAFMAIVMHHTLVRHTRTSVVGNSRASGTTAEEEKDEIVAQGASLLIEPMVLISESRGNPQQWRPSRCTENWLLEFFVQHAHEMSPHGSEGRSRTALLLDMILENSRRVMSHVVSTNLDDGSAEKRVVDLIAHCAPSHLIVKLVETLLCQSRRDLINTADRVGRRGKYSFSSGNVKWTPFEYLCRLSRTMRALSTNVNLLVSSETPPHQGGGENGKGTGVNSAHAQHVCKLLPAVLDNLVPLIEAPLRDLGEHEGPAATHCGSNNNGPIDALIMQLEISLNALRGAFPSLFDAVAPIALMCVTRASRAPRSISSSTTITIPYSGNNQSSAVPVSNTHDRVCLSDAQLSFGTKLLEHCLQSPRCQDSLIDRIIVPTESLLYVTEQQRVRLGLEPWTAAHKSNALVCGTATTEQPLIVNAAQNILATHLVVGSWAEGLRVHRSLMGTKEFTGEAEGEAARPTDCRLISSLLSRSSRLTVPLHEKVIWPKFFSEVVDALASHHLRQTAVAELYSRVTLAFGSMACEESSSPNRGQLAGIRSPLQLSSDSSPKWALAFKAFRDITSKPQDRDTVIATLRDGRRDGIETLVRLSDVILLCMEKCGVSKIEIEALSKELQVTTTSGQAQEQENGDVETKIKATTPDHRQGNAVQKPSLGTEADVNNESSQTHNHDVYGEGIPKLPSAIGNKNSNNGNVSSVGTQNNYYPKPTTRNSNGMSLSASLYQSSFRAVAHSDPSKALAVYTRELREETRPSMVTLAAAAKACSVQAHKCWAQSLALLRQAALSSRKGQPPAEMIATTLKTLIDAGRWKEASSLCQKVNRASRDAASANYHNELGHGDEGRRDGKSKNNSHHNNDGHSQGVGILGTPRHAYSNSLTLREAVGLSWAKTYVGSDADRVDAVLLMADITIKCLVLAKAWDEAVNQFYSLIVNGVSVSAPTDKGFVLRRRYVHPSPTTIRAALDACAHASALVRQSTANVLNFAGALEDLVCVGGELLRHVIRVVAEAEAESKRNFIAAPADEELAGAREIDNNRAGEAWAWGCGCPLLLDINRNARFVVKNEQHTLLGGKQVRVGGQEIERNGSLFSAGLDGDDLIWFNGHRYDHFSRLFCDPLHVAL